MALQIDSKINWLQRHLPDGLLVDAGWLSQHGYSPQLRRHYLASGWLEQPASHVYQQPPPGLSWQSAVISLQTLLGKDLAVGGRSAPELHGVGHYLQQEATAIYLYGPRHPPKWLDELPTGVRFAYRNDGRLFRQERVSTSAARRMSSTSETMARSPKRAHCRFRAPSCKRAFLHFTN